MKYHIGARTSTRKTALKFAPRYEFAFVLDNDIADAVLASATCRMRAKSIRLSICDRGFDATDSWNSRPKKAGLSTRYRVRRTDRSKHAFLQRKRWDGNSTSLRQTSVPSNETARLTSTEMDKSWDGNWFHKKLVKRGMVASVETQFDRTLIESETIDGAVRLTIDRNILVQSLHSNHDPVIASSSLPDRSVVRMKFFVSLPTVFKALVYEFALLPVTPIALDEFAIARGESIQKSISAPIAFEPIDEVATCLIG